MNLVRDRGDRVLKVGHARRAHSATEAQRRRVIEPNTRKPHGDRAPVVRELDAHGELSIRARGRIAADHVALDGDERPHDPRVLGLSRALRTAVVPRGNDRSTLRFTAVSVARPLDPRRARSAARAHDRRAHLADRRGSIRAVHRSVARRCRVARSRSARSGITARARRRDDHSIRRCIHRATTTSPPPRSLFTAARRRDIRVGGRHLGGTPHNGRTFEREQHPHHPSCARTQWIHR